MPLYEFRCQDCQEVSEFQLKLVDPNPEKCPQCQGGPLQKLISNTAFSLKGGGWYSDLYSSSSKKADGSKSAEGPKSTEGSKGTDKTSTPAAPSSGTSGSSSTPASKSTSTPSTKKD